MLTAEEAAFTQQSIDARNADRRDGGARRTDGMTNLLAVARALEAQAEGGK